MDFKKFGNIILVIAIIVFAYGGLKYLGNQSEENNSTNLGQRLQTGQANLGRAQKRNNAKNIMIYSGIGIIIGGGISYSAEEKDSEESN
ncbi:hypothetical protein [Fodinibius saliphilus]|uniref:hypothetical protein n=1 Tax=Fodinibius saliphilus TaxID=1920650 RepID=UPI001107D6CB|nr:hypothetical protein [Fodinibius saliphilus]